eukprot:11057895-Lingulodinium_polyedra.AAC.1
MVARIPTREKAEQLTRTTSPFSSPPQPPHRGLPSQSPPCSSCSWRTRACGPRAPRGSARCHPGP